MLSKYFFSVEKVSKSSTKRDETKQNKNTWQITELGYSRKIPHPHYRRHGLLTPPAPPPPQVAPEFPKLLEPPSPQDFQVQRPPTHPGFHKIVRHHSFNLHSLEKNYFRHLDDLKNKSQFSMNNVSVVKVKITFSHLLKQAYTICK